MYCNTSTVISGLSRTLSTVCTLDYNTICVNYVYIFYRRILIRPRWDSQTLMLRHRTTFWIVQICVGSSYCLSIRYLLTISRLLTVQYIQSVWVMLLLPTASLLVLVHCLYQVCTPLTKSRLQYSTVWVIHKDNLYPYVWPTLTVVPYNISTCWLRSKPTMLFWIQTSLCRHTLMDAV
jgi:hypothetical protein